MSRNRTSSHPDTSQPGEATVSTLSPGFFVPVHPVLLLGETDGDWLHPSDSILDTLLSYLLRSLPHLLLGCLPPRLPPLLPPCSLPRLQPRDWTSSRYTQNVRTFAEITIICINWLHRFASGDSTQLWGFTLSLNVKFIIQILHQVNGQWKEMLSLQHEGLKYFTFQSCGL